MSYLHMNTGTGCTLTAGEISDPEEYIKSLRDGLSKETGERIMTGAEQLIEIGEKRGLQKGKIEGALDGERTILKRQLEKRFGSVPSSYLEKIENDDADSLLKIGDKIIEAKTLEDVFKTYH